MRHDNDQTAVGAKPAGAGARETVEMRRRVMGLLANSTEQELSERLASLENIPGSEEIRRPEIGAVMVRGRMGGDGKPFNLGEATVTRASVRLATGETGTSYVLGRHPGKARIAALIDALWQRPEFQSVVEERVLAPIARRLDADAAKRAAETAATRVEFFTVVRGED